MKAEDIHVTFDKISFPSAGSGKSRSTPSKTRLHQMEVDYGKFQRTIRIPSR